MKRDNTAASVQEAVSYAFDIPGYDIAGSLYAAVYVPPGLGVLAIVAGILYNFPSLGR